MLPSPSSHTTSSLKPFHQGEHVCYRTNQAAFACYSCAVISSLVQDQAILFGVALWSVESRRTCWLAWPVGLWWLACSRGGDARQCSQFEITHHVTRQWGSSSWSTCQSRQGLASTGHYALLVWLGCYQVAS